MYSPHVSINTLCRLGPGHVYSFGLVDLISPNRGVRKLKRNLRPIFDSVIKPKPFNPSPFMKTVKSWEAKADSYASKCASEQFNKHNRRRWRKPKVQYNRKKKITSKNICDQSCDRMKKVTSKNIRDLNESDDSDDDSDLIDIENLEVVKCARKNNQHKKMSLDWTDIAQNDRKVLTRAQLYNRRIKQLALEDYLRKKMIKLGIN